MSSGVRQKDGYRSLVLTVQSSKLNGAGLTSHINEFLEDFVNSMTDSTRGGLTDASLREFKNAISLRLLEPDQRLTGQAERFWGEILLSNSRASVTNTPKFNRRMMEVEALNSVSLPDFLSFSRNILLKGGSNHRLLVSRVSSTAAAGIEKGASQLQDDLNLLVIDNEERFRKSLELLP